MSNISISEQLDRIENKINNLIDNEGIDVKTNEEIEKQYSDDSFDPTPIIVLVAIPSILFLFMILGALNIELLKPITDWLNKFN